MTNSMKERVRVLSIVRAFLVGLRGELMVSYCVISPKGEYIRESARSCDLAHIEQVEALIELIDGVMP